MYEQVAPTYSYTLYKFSTFQYICTSQLNMICVLLFITVNDQLFYTFYNLKNFIYFRISIVNLNLKHTNPSIIRILHRRTNSFYMEEANKLSNRFIQFSYFLIMGQQGPKHIEVSGFYNAVVNLTKLYGRAGLNCSN
jgi:hypothetical protein